MNVTIFGVEFHVYGLIIGLAIMLGGFVARLSIERAERMGLKLSVKQEMVWNAIWWAVIGGIVGARLYHVVDAWEFYSGDWGRIMAVWNGGLGIYGAMLGGVVGLMVFSYRKQLVFWEVMDVSAMGLVVGQVLGRWANYVNQELYGRPTQAFWGIRIDEQYRLPGYELVETYHPLFLYESVLMLLVASLMWWQMSKGKWLIGQGRLAAFYLIGYGIVRFSLEGLRIDNWQIAGMAVAQIVSVIAIIMGVFIWKRR